MNFRNISAWAIRNPVPPIVLFMALTLAGIVSFMRMDLNQDPEITFPGVIVTISQPGAAPTELETQVTQRVEAAVRNLEGVDEINSVISEGTSVTTVEFTIETPVDRATTDVRDAVSQIRGQLPEGILEPQIARAQVNGGSFANFSVEARDMTMEQLSWYVQNIVSRRLLAISGMQAVNVNGAVSREIRVILDPAKMQAQGVTAAQINTQLRAMNLNAAGGRAEVAGAEQSVRVLGNAADAYALGDTQVQLATGRSVKLSDIATVRDAYGERRNLAIMNGKSVVTFGLIRSRGSSEVTLYDEALPVLAQLEKENPKIHFIRRMNQTKYTRENYRAAMHAMIEGAALAVAVVFLFLRDKRATVISALAIPLSAIPTFWVLSLLGFSLNFMTLLALSLVAGVLVDDAIVEIENIVRHMRMGKTAYQASIDAADEIGLAVVGTTFSIVAVFLPVGLMPGIPGQFFKNFGLTVVTAVLMSLLVARLITPMIAAYFLKAHGEAPHGEGVLMDRYMSVLRWTLDDSGARRAAARGGWARVFSFVHDHRWWTMGIGLISFFCIIGLAATTPTTFQPPQDSDTSRVQLTMAPGTTLEQTRDVAERAVAILKQQQEVETVVDFVNVGNANITINLRENRKRPSYEFERQVAPLLAHIPDGRFNFQSRNGNGRDVSIMLAGDDPVQLNRASLSLVDEMRQMPGIRSPRIEGDLPRPEITIKPRLDLAADLGVTTQALSQTIRIATLGDIDQNAAKFSLSDRQIPIRVMLDEDSRRSLSTIQNLPVQTARGGTVPLKVVADIGFGAGPSQIQRYNQERRMLITADLAPGAISGDQRAKVMQLPAMKNLPLGVHYAAAGEAKWQGELITNFIIAVIAGVLLVFAVLVLLYRRVMPPFINMGSLLLAPLGGLIALKIAGMPLSLPVFIGLLMLLGIVAKNSILLIDFAIDEMRSGVPLFEAVVDAGHKRAQPIVMTTVAMVAGMLPTALSLGGDGSFNQPMAVTVIGGLLLSTLLTLLIVPAGFSIADGVEKWMGRKLGWAINSRDEATVPPGLAQPASEPTGVPVIVIDDGRDLPRMNAPAPATAGAAGVTRMRIIATGLLVAMALLFVLAGRLAAFHPGWGFVRAFAEAAMVGGLADWFAVTALFRHPLGLPIPHTAIIPRNKDRIGDSLAAFLRANFLVPGIVARRMAKLDIAAAIGRVLAAPPRQGPLSGGAGKMAVTLLESLGDEQLGQLFKSAAAQRLRALDLAPLAGQLLSASIAEGRHRPLINRAILWIGRTLDANEAIFRQMIHERAGSILRWTGLDETLSTKILDGIFRLLGDMAEDQDHPVRQKADEALATLAHRLQHDAELQAKVAAWRDSALANPAVAAWLDGLWQSARAAMLRAARDPQAAAAGKLGEALRQFGQKLQQDDRVRVAVNRFARRTAGGLVASYGNEIVALVSETVRRWDAQTVTDRLESAVGRDLQYIRVNGTLVGGLVGLIIHTVEVLA